MNNLESIEKSLNSLYSYLRDNGFVSQSQKLIPLLKFIRTDFSKFKKEVKRKSLWSGWNSILDVDIRNKKEENIFKDKLLLFLLSLDSKNISYPCCAKSPDLEGNNNKKLL